MKISRILGVLVIVALMVPATPAEAQLEYSLTPYLWGSSLDGSFVVNDRGGDVSASFSDILDNLEVAVPIHFEAQGPVFGLIAEVFYVGLGQDLESIEGELEVDMLMFELLSSWEWTPSVQVIFGARYVELEQTVAVVGPLETQTLSQDQQWVDPVIGIRYGGELNRRGTWLASFRADGAGFGLGDGTDFTWNVRTGIGYKFNDTVALWGGWHWMDTDYEVENFQYQMLQQGPELGLMFSW